MPRLVSVLFMLLLVLRSLMGSAMAAAPLPSLPAPAMHHTAQPAQALLLASTSTADGAQHDQQLLPLQPDSASSACPDAAGPGCADHTGHADHADCTTCAWCHSAMLAPPALRAHRAPVASRTTARTATRFASAQAALAIKPPIA